MSVGDVKYRCDYCKNKLGENSYVCRDYFYITCTPGCLAKLMLDVQKVNTKQYFKNNIFSIKNVM